MDRNIKRNVGLIVTLIICALITGCSPAGGDEEQDQSMFDGSDSKPRSEEVQNPVTEPDSRDTQNQAHEVNQEGKEEQADDTPDRPSNPENPPAAETPTGPAASESTDGTPAEETPVSPPAMAIPEGTTPEAFQRSPGEPGLPPYQGVASRPAILTEWDLLAVADVSGDGLEEEIYLDKTEIDSGSVTLRVYDSDGNEIWNEGAGIAHAGWNSLFLYEEGGKYCLMRYNPYMGQGNGSYNYILFLLEGTDENVIGGDLIDFDINGTKEFDVPGMVYFAETVNSLLAESTLLVSSKGGEFTFGPSSAEPFFERFSWLDLMPELYESGDDLETRLYKYSEFAIEQRNRYN